MTRAIVWKELREQGLIALTLIAIGSGVLIAAATLAAPPSPSAPAVDIVRHLGVGLLSTLMLSVTAGMVSGGAVFAAEREAGTLGFLDALPVSRGRVWRAKLVAGLGLAMIQVGALVGVAAALSLVPSLGWARAVAVFALLAFVWGVFGSTVSRTTLGSVGVAIVAGTLTAIVVLVPILLFVRSPGSPIIRTTEAAVFLAFMFLIPVVLSGWVFTAPDRLRSAAEEITDERRAGRFRLEVGALLWLATRQLRTTAWVLAGFAAVFGLSLLAPGAQAALNWPALALAAGVLTGVTTFGDEQTRGTARFWGEQRLPIGRAWAVKVGLHFLLCLGLLLLLAIPLMFRTQLADRASFRMHTLLGLTFRSHLFDELGSQGWKYLLVPAVYGFVTGHLCGLVFRKLVVACGVAGIVGGVAAAAWGPSLLSGGVSHWQLWLPPAVLLLTARRLIPDWAADRVASRRGLGTLVGGCLACFLVMGAGIGYRVLEVPDRDDGEADVGYVASLPPYEMNSGGNTFRMAADRYARTVGLIMAESDRQAVSANQPTPILRIEQRLEEVLRRGWPGDDPELTTWLDRLYAPPPEQTGRSAMEIAAGVRPMQQPPAELWHAIAAGAAAMPPGIFDYPQLSATSWRREATLSSGQRMAVALLADGLRKQAAGNPLPFFLSFRTSVLLARSMRNGSYVASYQTGVAIEHYALMALDRWLERASPRPGLLQAALAPFPPAAPSGVLLAPPHLMRAMIGLLEEDDPAGPFDPTPHFLAERHLIRESLQAPAESLPRVFGYRYVRPEAPLPEVDLVALAWAVPWERERTRRLVGLGFENGPTADHALVRGRPGAGILTGERALSRPRTPKELIDLERGLRANRRAGLLKLALLLHQSEHGKYPDSARPDALGALVAGGYLRRVPVDPFNEAQPFGYRIAPPGGITLRPRPRAMVERMAMSTGETVSRDVPAGQPMVWTSNPDLADQRGPQNPPPPNQNGPPPDGLVFLVPLRPNP